MVIATISSWGFTRPTSEKGGGYEVTTLPCGNMMTEWEMRTWMVFHAGFAGCSTWNNAGPLGRWAPDLFDPKPRCGFVYHPILAGYRFPA